LLLLESEVDTSGGQVLVPDASGVGVIEGLHTGENGWRDIIRSVELINVSSFSNLLRGFGNPPFLTGIFWFSSSNGYPTDFLIDEFRSGSGGGLVGSLFSLELDLEASLGHESIPSDIWNVGLKRHHRSKDDWVLFQDLIRVEVSD
jgi:hypothetical protein